MPPRLTAVVAAATLSLSGAVAASARASKPAKPVPCTGVDAEFDFERIVVEQEKQARKKHGHKKKHRCASAAAREFVKSCR